VEVYGSWLPKSAVPAVNRVFAAAAPAVVGRKVVTEGISEAAARP
jgi:hypothetical protein